MHKTESQLRSPSKNREEAYRLEDDLTMLQAERVVSNTNDEELKLRRSRSRRSEPIDEFDAATNPLHEKAAVYAPPEHPTTNIAKIFKKIHNSSWLIRYLSYIAPLVIILLVPLLLGALVFKQAAVGGVRLMWFSIWLEIVWLTLWAGRIVAKMIPWPLGLVASLFTNNSKKWRDLGKALEVPATIFFWWLGVLISFLPTMQNHHLNHKKATREWERIVNKIIVSAFVGAVLNFFEKIIIQLIAISFHLRTYDDRIQLNKFQIGSLTKLYHFSKEKIAMEDSEFEEKSGPASGARTPGIYADKATKAAKGAINKVGDLAGAVAGDFTGKKVNKSNHPHQVVLTLLNSTTGSQVLARRLYRTFVRDGFDTVFSGDLKSAFDNDDEAEAAFSMFDKDMNGDISMEELEAVCVEIGRERKSITASLKDLDSVVGKLDDVLMFVVAIITVLVLISLISTSAAGVLTSAGSTILALSWLLSATAQEFLQSCIFVFIKHPFDVGDRVSIYGSTGSTLTGDDYFVKEISLLFTEFKKMEGHVVQAPNSYLNTLFILNMRRSGGLAEAVPIVIAFGTTLQQIDDLRQTLLEFVRSEKREYQGNILTELREVTEAYSLTLNVVFFYKSNWQNEGLRLQRRNKFICAMMVAMQDLGIQGPRRNLPGARQDIPWHFQGAQNAFGSSSSNNNNQGPDPGSEPFVSRDGDQPAGKPPIPSILRTRASSNSRSRSESVSAMARRVDFSLGMRDMASSDMTGDVYEDRSRSRVPPAVRLANMSEAERRIAEESQDDLEKDRKSSKSRDRSGSNARTTSADIPTSHGARPSTDSSTHRNRFMEKFGRSRASQDQADGASAAEEGRVDARSNTITPARATSDDRIPSWLDQGEHQQPRSVGRSQTVDFEARRNR
ncbi:putative mechanosensitive ion channel family [Phaeomoniella chlamydospora]|uniref:Mechanosensitive ion channel protein n=1 Tax=Phaeomoniella chlamydospora TaxID=158046 RepID=A0A0G2EW83_PHACM|nr:putative mechanosensitive ion channel family [Phaeomoniella chlamydospora]